MVVRKQRGGLGVDAKDHVAAVAAAGSVRTTEGLELFAFDGDTAVPTGTTGDMEDHSVDEGCHG